MSKRPLAAFLLALAALAAPAAAADHEVVMFGAGYFPETVHPEPGETVRFVNGGSLAMSATAVDGSWTTGLVPAGIDVVIPVTEGMTKAYDSAGSEGEAPDLPPVVGRIEWSLPSPVNLGTDGTPHDD